MLHCLPRVREALVKEQVYTLLQGQVDESGGSGDGVSGTPALTALA